MLQKRAVLESRPVADSDPQSSYRSLFGDLRENVRAYLRGMLLLPRQEIRELVAANLRAAAWIIAGLVFALLALIALVVLFVALLALVLPLWASALVFALVFLAVGGTIAYFLGVKRLQLRGPERTIRSVKETIAWVKATLLGRSAS